MVPAIGGGARTLRKWRKDLARAGTFQPARDASDSRETSGKPLANMLVNAGATVTVCHSGTRDIPHFSRLADVVFVATGRSRSFGREYFRDGQVIIDAGIGFIDGKLAGDVDFQSLESLELRVTPVPGGVGPPTSVLILENLPRLIEFVAHGNMALATDGVNEKSCVWAIENEACRLLT